MKSELIIKGVRRCLSPRLSDCNGCPYRCIPRQECRNALMGNVISLFNRMEQQAHAIEQEAHLKWEKEVIRDGVLINEDECIKALEKRLNELCIGCDHEDEEWHKSVCPTCIFYHAKVAVSVINNRQKAKIERLKKELIEQQLKNNLLYETAKETKAEAIREFAERLKAEATLQHGGVTVVYGSCIDNLVKEMTEKEDNG